jgi:CcmD family protein
MDARNFTFMFYGFAAAWGVIALYVVIIALRESSLRKELDRVKRMVEEREHEAKR